MTTREKLAFKQGDIRCRKNRFGIWEISHPDKNGTRLNYYSTGIRGTKKDIQQYLEDNKIPELVSLARSGMLARQVLSRIMAGRKVTIQSSFEEWQDWLQVKNKAARTIDNYRVAFWKLIEHIGLSGTDTPHLIDEKKIHDFINREDTNQKLSTRRLYIYSLRSYFDFASAKGYIAGNPASIVGVNMSNLTQQQKEKKEIPSFTDDEYTRLLLHFRTLYERYEKLLAGNPYRGKTKVTFAENQEKKILLNRFFYVFTKLSYTLGLRLSDVAQLEWFNFSIPEHFVVWTDKRDYRIEIPLSGKAIDKFVATATAVDDKDALKRALLQIPPVIDEVMDIILPEDPTYCFPAQRQDHLSVKRRSKHSVYFARALKKVGIEGKSLHGLRHTRIRLWEEQGISLKTIGKLVAHKSESTTKGYL